jgi:hypothetical protein
MKTVLVGLVLVVSTGWLGAESQLIPLVDPSDPLLITNSKIEFVDDVRPVVVVELENRTGLPIGMEAVQLNITRFYTKSEAAQRGRQVWDCGRVGHVDYELKDKIIAPHAREIVTVALKDSCQHNREHEHFFVTLARLQGFHSREPAWVRDPKDLARMLAAAQPHP